VLVWKMSRLPRRGYLSLNYCKDIGFLALEPHIIVNMHLLLSVQTKNVLCQRSKNGLSGLIVLHT